MPPSRVVHVEHYHQPACRSRSLRHPHEVSGRAHVGFVVRDHQPIAHYEFRVLQPDGGQRWLAREWIMPKRTRELSAHRHGPARGRPVCGRRCPWITPARRGWLPFLGAPTPSQEGASRVRAGSFPGGQPVPSARPGVATPPRAECKSANPGSHGDPGGHPLPSRPTSLLRSVDFPHGVASKSWRYSGS